MDKITIYLDGGHKITVMGFLKRDKDGEPDVNHAFRMVMEARTAFVTESGSAIIIQKSKVCAVEVGGS